MNRSWGWELLVYLFSFLLGYAISQAFGAEVPVQYKGAEGYMHQHNPQWEGLWIANDFPSCCGERDCFKAGQGEVEVQRLEDGTGYIVLWAQTNGTEPIAEFLPYDSPRLRPSQDGEYWACHMLVNGDSTRRTRCLFVPPLGF
jgi:hypothetical protein